MIGIRGPMNQKKGRTDQSKAFTVFEVARVTDGRTSDLCEVAWAAIRISPTYKDFYEKEKSDDILHFFGLKQPLDPSLDFQSIRKDHPDLTEIFATIPQPLLEHQRFWKNVWLESIEAFRLVRIEGMSVKDASERLGLKQITLRKRIDNAKKIVILDEVLRVPCNDCKHLSFDFIDIEGNKFQQGCAKKHGPRYKCAK
jgi:predicted DNA-binding protein (UPF0251 family)